MKRLTLSQQMNQASYIDADPKLSAIKYNQMTIFLNTFTLSTLEALLPNWAFLALLLKTHSRCL